MFTCAHTHPHSELLIWIDGWEDVDVICYGLLTSLTRTEWEEVAWIRGQLEWELMGG